MAKMPIFVVHFYLAPLKLFHAVLKMSSGRFRIACTTAQIKQCIRTMARKICDMKDVAS